MLRPEKNGTPLEEFEEIVFEKLLTSSPNPRRNERMSISSDVIERLPHVGRGLNLAPGGRRGSVRFVLRCEPFGGRPVSRQRRATDVEHSQHASCYRRCSRMPDYRRPSFVSLSVEPHVLHSQSVVDAVDHRGVALDIGVPAGAGTIVPEDRPGRLFRQLALDPPYQLLALDRVELH